MYTPGKNVLSVLVLQSLVSPRLFSSRDPPAYPPCYQTEIVSQTDCPLHACACHIFWSPELMPACAPKTAFFFFFFIPPVAIRSVISFRGSLDPTPAHTNPIFFRDQYDYDSLRTVRIDSHCSSKVSLSSGTPSSDVQTSFLYSLIFGWIVVSQPCESYLSETV